MKLTESALEGVIDIVTDELVDKYGWNEKDALDTATDYFKKKSMSSMHDIFDKFDSPRVMAKNIARKLSKGEDLEDTYPESPDME